MSGLPEAAAVLAEHRTLALATSRGDRPWAALVFFAEEVIGEELLIHFATLAPSRKLRHLEANPTVGFAAGSDNPDRWLQGRGAAERVDDPGERRRVTGLIAAKTPYYEAFLGAVGVVFFRIVVDEFRVVDLTGGTPKTWWKRA